MRDQCKAVGLPTLYDKSYSILGIGRLTDCALKHVIMVYCTITAWLWIMSLPDAGWSVIVYVGRLFKLFKPDS